jgi:hypothetical protein
VDKTCFEIRQPRPPSAYHDTVIDEEGARFLVLTARSWHFEMDPRPAVRVSRRHLGNLLCRDVFCFSIRSHCATTSGFSEEPRVEIGCRITGFSASHGLNGCSYLSMSTRRPRNRTPSICRRRRCSAAPSPGSLISPPRPTMRCHGKVGPSTRSSRATARW